MTLVVHAPPSYQAERRYVLDVVLADRLGLTWRLETHERPEVRVTLAGDGERAELTMPDILFGTDPSRWLSVASLPVTPVPRIRVGDVGSEILNADERLPAIYRGVPEPTRLVEVGPGRVRLQVDVFGSAFFMLSRYEEVAMTFYVGTRRLPTGTVPRPLWREWRDPKTNPLKEMAN